MMVVLMGTVLHTYVFNCLNVYIKIRLLDRIVEQTMDTISLSYLMQCKIGYVKVS